MPISSLIVRTKDNEANNMAEKIDHIQFSTVTQIQENTIIVLTETKHRDDDKNVWEQLESLPAVLGIDLIYYNFEDIERA